MNGKAWLGRLLPRKAPGPAKATRKASRRPSSPLRELEREQAAAWRQASGQFRR